MRRLLPRVTIAVALFPGAHFQSPKMFPQRLAHERGTISFHSARGLVSGAQQLHIENNLDDFHMLTLFHSILHIPVSGRTKLTERAHFVPGSPANRNYATTELPLSPHSLLFHKSSRGQQCRRQIHRRGEPCSLPESENRNKIAAQHESAQATSE